MALLQERPAGGEMARRERSRGDKLATVLLVVAFALSIGAVVGYSGPSGVFMAAAPVIVVLTGFPAMMGMLMERWRGGFVRLLLAVGAALLIAAGARWLGSAPAGRILIAYFIPAALFAWAALTVAAPRLRTRST